MLTTTNHSSTATTEKDEWRTPPALFDQLARAYGPFDLDGAATAANTLCPHWLGAGSPLGVDALTVAWLVDGRPCRVFCNPPYRRGLVGQFVAKAALEAGRGHCQATLLVPAATDQYWWHAYVWSQRLGGPYPPVVLDFPRGRVRFLRPDGRPAGSPTFASVVVTFRRATELERR